jgi:hypothetical protein
VAAGVTGVRRRRLRLDTGTWGLTVPGVPSARLVILCGPCFETHGMERELGVFEMDTGADAGRVVWTVPFHIRGGAAGPSVRGAGDAARVKLICGAKAGRGGKSGGGCRHTPDVPVAWITAQLAVIRAGEVQKALR